MNGCPSCGQGGVCFSLSMYTLCIAITMHYLTTSHRTLTALVWILWMHLLWGQEVILVPLPCKGTGCISRINASCLFVVHSMTYLLKLSDQLFQLSAWAGGFGTLFQDGTYVVYNQVGSKSEQSFNYLFKSQTLLVGGDGMKSQMLPCARAWHCHTVTGNFAQADATNWDRKDFRTTSFYYNTYRSVELFRQDAIFEHTHICVRCWLFSPSPVNAHWHRGWILELPVEASQCFSFDNTDRRVATACVSKFVVEFNRFRIRRLAGEHWLKPWIRGWVLLIIGEPIPVADLYAWCPKIDVSSSLRIHDAMPLPSNQLPLKVPEHNADVSTVFKHTFVLSILIVITAGEGVHRLKRIRPGLSFPDHDHVIAVQSPMALQYTSSGGPCRMLCSTCFADLIRRLEDVGCNASLQNPLICTCSAAHLAHLTLPLNSDFCSLQS